MIGRLEVALYGLLSGAIWVPGKSTEDAWWYGKESIQQSNAKYVLVIVVDFQDTFGNLEWDRVIQKLIDIGCDQIGLCTSYFIDRCS